MKSHPPSEARSGVSVTNVAQELLRRYEALDAAEASRFVSRLSIEEQVSLFSSLSTEEATRLIESLPAALSVAVLEVLSSERAAAILDHLPSDEQTDIVGQLDATQAEVVLDHMSPAEAADVQLLRRYPAESAGGLMITEYLAFPEHERVVDVVQRLRQGAPDFSQYPVQYVYVVTQDRKLVGVMQLRDLLFLGEAQTLASASLRPPAKLPIHAGFEEIRRFFATHDFLAAPITDENDRLIGVVTRRAIEEAAFERAEHMFLRFSGIFAGEEFRTMPLATRTSRRLAWLSITVVLNLLSASVVGLFSDTLSAVIALAVFLPVISGMSGNAGNQAVAVTMRELTLGLITPLELSWVIAKEAIGAAINGLILGIVLGLAAYAWQRNLYLALVVGAAQAVSILLAACLGGSLPLVLKRMKVDPALAAAPILTTLSDVCGFLLTLGLATTLLPLLR